MITIYFESGATQVIKLGNQFHKTDIEVRGNKTYVKDNLTALVHDIAMGEPIKNYSYERV